MADIDTPDTLTPAELRWYVAGPLDPAKLAYALRAVHTELATVRGHDVYSALYDADLGAKTRYGMPQFEQISRVVLSVLVGIGALEVKDPVRALQLWRANNRDVSLEWAFGEAVSLISPEDRARIEKNRSAERERRGMAA